MVFCQKIRKYFKNEIFNIRYHSIFKFWVGLTFLEAALAGVVGISMPLVFKLNLFEDQVKPIFGSCFIPEWLALGVKGKDV